MNPLTLGEIRSALPELEELEPLMTLLLVTSEPDLDRAWARSAEVGTADDRLVSTRSGEDADELADRASDHLRSVFRPLFEVVDALKRSDRDRAARLFLDVAAIEEEYGRSRQGEAYAKAAVQLAGSGQDRALQSLAIRRRARTLLALGHFDEALASYRQAHEFAVAASDLKGEAEAAIGAGNVLEREGLWPEAAEWYRRAIGPADRSSPPGPERWHARLNLHIVIRSEGQVEESERWLGEAARLATEVEDTFPSTPFENAKGQLAAAQGDPSTAEKHFQKALETAEGARAKTVVSLNLAEAMLAQGRTLEAAEQARRGERHAIAGALTSHLPEAYRLLGRIAHSEGNPEAFVLFERALELVAVHQLPLLERAITLQAYADVERARGNPESARAMRSEARSILRDLGIRNLRQPWSDSYGSRRGREKDQGDELP